MQDSGADILKRAMRIFYDLAKPYNGKVMLVNIVHDELIVEAPDELVPEVTKKLETAMKQSWYENVEHVKIKVDTTVLQEWQKG
jgi:DNA polymerase-1